MAIARSMTRQIRPALTSSAFSCLPGKLTFDY